MEDGRAKAFQKFSYRPDWLLRPVLRFYRWLVGSCVFMSERSADGEQHRRYLPVFLFRGRGKIIRHRQAESRFQSLTFSRCSLKRVDALENLDASF